jgi:hypothetical protein
VIDRTLLNHEWVAPDDLLLDHTNWSPGACAFMVDEQTGKRCGVHLLTWQHPESEESEP